MRFIGLDIHRDFCEVAICLPGERARSAGRIATEPEKLRLFAESLDRGDRVVMESTGNALAIARVLEGHVAEVALANPMQVRAISHAKVKNDRYDARTLAELFQAGVLPTVWPGDERTRCLRRLTSRRSQLIRARTRAKNEITAVLVRNLAGRPPASDLFGKRGRAWLAELELPDDERLTVEGCLRQVDFLSAEVDAIDRQIAESALHSPEIKRLMTIPGVDVTSAATLMPLSARSRASPATGTSWGISGSTPACASPATPPHGMGGSQSKAHRPLATCWSRLLGQRSRHQGRCAPSTSASEPAAAPRSRSWPLPASSPSCPGSSSQSKKTMRSSAPRSSRRSSAPSSYAPAHPAAAAAGKTGRAHASAPNKSASYPSKPSEPTYGSSTTGKHPGQLNRVRAPHRGAHLKSRQAAKQHGSHKPQNLHFRSRSTRTTPSIPPNPSQPRPNKT